jgi:hypothetical protein
MWRKETLGSVMLLLNTVLHFDHLDIGRTPGVASSGSGRQNK